MKIIVSSHVKFPMKDFHLVEENAGIEIEIEANTPEELDAKIEEWQTYIHKKVIKGAFRLGNDFMEKHGDIKAGVYEEDNRVVKKDSLQ